MNSLDSLNPTQSLLFRCLFNLWKYNDIEVKLARNRSNAAHDKMTKNLILDRLDAELTEAEIRRKASLVELIDFLDKMNLDHSEVIDLMNPHIN